MLQRSGLIGGYYYSWVSAQMAIAPTPQMLLPSVALGVRRAQRKVGSLGSSSPAWFQTIL